MTEEAILFFAFLASNIFWAVVCLKLTNRLMSRNYHEFVGATKKVAPKKRADIDDGPDAFAEAQAEQLNSLMVL